MQLYSKLWLLALFCISLERLNRILFKPHHKIFTIYITVSETLVKIDSLQYLKDKRILERRTGQKSALQHLLFWQYGNFSKLMWAIHTSTTSTFQCEYWQCFTKDAIKFKLQSTSQWNFKKHDPNSIDFEAREDKGDREKASSIHTLFHR